ncbi:GDYXXLXY domain-containing protein [Cellvibrio sp. UBA7661]|uniref:GDYXXLXY domain-containing protein n=1 Tax=Cellvibrio sp. UBA7661 TaxID=1946311 RepID=UPI002F35E8FE
MSKVIAVAALVVVLGLVNWSIIEKEKHLAQGDIVYLELAPVDPRSLIQGDYMALEFRVAQQIYDALPKSDKYRGWNRNADAGDGFVVVKLDAERRADFVRIYTGGVLDKNEIKMQYRVRNGAVKFATNAFFFQEGHAQSYEAARYGQFRVNTRGEVLLAGMFDKDLKHITGQ